VLTHRDKKSPFNNIGHADIVETQNGEWYAVTLGVRAFNGLTIMDRETFLVKFHWENGWPVFNPEGDGIVLEVDKRPNLPWTPVKNKSITDDFLNPKLSNDFNFYHTPQKKWWSLTDRKGWLRIALQSAKTIEQTNSPIIARKITEFDFEASTIIDFDPKNNETAGLIVIMNQNGQFRLEVFNKNNENAVRLVAYSLGRKTPLIEYVSDSEILDSKSVTLKVKAKGLDYYFYVKTKDGNFRKIGKVMDGTLISRQRIGSYSGAYVGVFGSSNGQKSNNHADFDSFTYKTLNSQNE
jgi:alpha-N-arabinofuranosidase